MPVNNSYESVITAKNPKVWFRFNETAGTPVNSGSLSCTLTAFGTPQLNNDSSVDGRAINFPDTSSYYTLTSFPSFSLFDDRSFSVETWFKMPTRTNTVWPTLFSFSTPGLSAQFFFARLLGTNSNQVGRLDIGFKPANGYSEYKNYTSTRVDDNKWHHLVVTVNTTSMKTYIDGALSDSTGIATPASIDFDDSSTEKYFGTLGLQDEFAMYDYELTAAQVNANYVAGAYVFFGDIPGTASALMVQPALEVNTTYAAAPMTASSLFASATPSILNASNLLEPYMATLTLEQWSKFDTGTTVLNYGSGGYGQWAAQGNIKVGNFGLGLQGSGCLVNTTTGSAGRLESLTVEGTAGAVYSNVVDPELRDQSFVLGFWFKATNNPAATILLAEGIDDSGTERFSIKLLTSGYVSLESQDPNETKTITNSTDLADGNWHFVTAKYDSGAIQLWIDATSVGTDTHGSVHTTQDYRDFYLLKNTETFSANNEILMSQFFIGTVANIGTTQISGIYTAGSNGVIQASATMPMPVVEFKNKYNDFVISKGAIIDLRMDEASGSPINFGTTSATFTKTGTNVTYSNATNNRFAYRLTSKDTTFEGPWSTTAGTFTTNNQQTLAVRVKIDGSATAANFIVGTAAYTNGVGIILQQMPTTNKYRLRLIKQVGGTYTFDDLQSVNSYNDNKYHHVVLTKNGTSLKIYVDGKLENSMNTAAVDLTDSGTFTLGGETTYGIPTTAAKNLYIDEAALFNYEMSAQEIFEFYQALSLEDGAGTGSSTFVMPTVAVGTGAAITHTAMTASTEFVYPDHSHGIDILHDHFEAFGAFVLPNYGANVNIDANYGHSAATSDALLQMPQVNIGDGHSAVPMTASALMGNVTVILPGQVQANPGVAIDATLVMPGIVTIKGARIFAEVLTVRAIFPLPPAYVQLTDDPYYVRLYAEHSQKTTEAAQTFAAAGTATTGFTAVAKSFLKFFNDVNQDITVGSARFLTNEMPDYVYDAVGTTYTDSNGNTIAPPTTKKSIVSAATRGSLTPTPMVSKGYFDAWDRKAVNFTNIEFNFGTDSQYHSQRQYSVEFTIKTTKSNQVMTYGNWASFYNYQSSIGTIGLFNGKLYSMETFQNIGKAAVIPHPANLDALAKAGLNTGYMLGNKRIDDGQWHHIVIQYGWEDGRTQYWIDGELDRQMIGNGSTPGSNGKNGIRPFIIGFNSNDSNLSSDFQTSVWSWTPNKFLLEQDISLNYEAAYKFSPIFAEPMLASMTATPNNQAAGNRGRALMLYFWPTNTAQRGGNYSPTFDAGTSGFDVPTFDPLLDTVDYIKNPPQEYEGWDVFPVDVAGYFVSDLVKVEAYGGVENILLGDGGGAVLTTGDANRAQWKFNARGTFRDALTDAPRYIDLVNDIDLTQFDAIFFKNFPDQSNEIDRFAKDEVVDSYFSIRELKIYEDFIKSVRAAVDTGLSLYVTNTELALDLGIIDRVEVVSDMNDIVGYDSDVYAPTHPFNLANSSRPISDGTSANVWMDTYKNNRFRLVNEVPGMTDFPTVILTDRLYWKNDDIIKWGGADVNLVRLQIKPNGLAVGDEWIESTYNPQINTKFYEAVPFANIKAGKPVVAFANQVRRDLDLIDNPYKDYATVIVVEPGNPLNGSLCGGKIYVNFTERLKDSVEDHGVDLIQDVWINYAESAGILTAEEATDLRAKTYNIDRQLAAGTINQATYNQKAYWSSNSDYILQQNTEIGDASDTPGRGGITKPKSQQVRKINKSGGISFTSASKGSQWFSVAFSYLYPRVTLDVPSMLTRGFWWVSNKEKPEGTVVRVLAMTASATSGQANAVPDKIVSVNAQSMLSSARITEVFESTANSINNVSLPMEASGLMNDKVFRVNAEPMRVTAAMTQLNRALTSAVDEVIVYIMHEDPILYLREEVIK